MGGSHGGVEMDRGALSLQGDAGHESRAREEHGCLAVSRKRTQRQRSLAGTRGDGLEELGGDAVSCSRFASRSSHVLRRGGTPGSAIERGEGG